MAAESADSRALKLVVFGGTGGTGKEVVTQALEQGYLVTAVVRTPERVEKRCGVKRLVTMTAWCTQPGPNNSWLVDWIINPLFLNGMIKDMAIMEKMLESTDPQVLSYTIVRPCGLINGERTGNYKVEEGQCNTGTKFMMTRPDVAEFLLKVLDSDVYDRRGFAIGGL
ncbi:uncharacterized protein LOC144656259 [Oculina patagonica]